MTTPPIPATRSLIAAGVDEIDRPKWLAPEQWPFALRRFEQSGPRS